MPSVHPDAVLQTPPFKLSRRRPAHTTKAFARHARHVGEITIEWNRLHAALFLLFWRIVSPSNYEVAYGIWHTIQSDSTQRQMLRSAAQAGLGKQRSVQSAVLWLIAQVDSLSQYRNDAAHVEVAFTYGELTVDPIAARKASTDRLEKRPVEKYWKSVCGDLRVLGTYAEDLCLVAFVNGPARRPLSRRPRLLNAPTKTTASQQSRRRKAKQARKPPPAP